VEVNTYEHDMKPKQQQSYNILHDKSFENVSEFKYLEYN